MSIACGGVHATVQAATISQADTSLQARRDGVASIPLDQLTAQTQEKISWVVSRPSIYRRLPVEQNRSDADMHLFLVRYPEVVVNIWERMEITKVSLKRTGPFAFIASDGAGTVSDVQLVYGTPTLHIYYATTQYTGPLLARPVTANCVLLMKTKYEEDSSGETVVTNQLDVFVRIKNRGIDLVAKTLQPLVGRAADFNFRESIKFMARVSRTAEENATGVQTLATRLDGCDEKVKQRFANLSELVAKRADERMIATRSRRPPTAQPAPPPVHVGQVPATPPATSPVPTAVKRLDLRR